MLDRCVDVEHSVFGCFWRLGDDRTLSFHGAKRPSLYLPLLAGRESGGEAASSVLAHLPAFGMGIGDRVRDGWKHRHRVKLHLALALTILSFRTVNLPGPTPRNHPSCRSLIGCHTHTKIETWRHFASIKRTLPNPCGSNSWIHQEMCDALPIASAAIPVLSRREIGISTLSDRATCKRRG